jgi:hypothetical protein
MFKPYPKNDADKPWRQMLARWEEVVGRAAQVPVS